ncbi:histidine kinase : Chemotaxis protein methyltransferase CheR OS=Chondromyces apiculatus DSM 436 GN=CAP_4027 PE=4 SV=1: Response_reg [Gemmataceae bacterium]|jgi:CheY-like chemotaxis protein|nr:histidine kinase : Chemotaxis protein methyltransferase CheR OS=Chondromyces apiculatus DSM 436 GN=CAP_4027 PE=4 SV=1: Response_reg [Gemmataceae bacterium]VTU02793.1 histidine kinase : Chemotaxis protein methyltransferase CheR OS=Chondromyces apiculatus DSM 436 GN=CAP_4027 PE=4 SV=1: Response_reg [Gemmataceae bacterium]
MTAATNEMLPMSEEQRGTETPAKTLRVLCVDDNTDAVDTLGAILDLLGFHVAVAHDAASALDVCENFAPQAAILDITMPGMDGYELAGRLRARPGGREMLLIALTALGDYRSMERMADVGFDLYYAKPVSSDLLRTVLTDFAARGRESVP